MTATDFCPTCNRPLPGAPGRYLTDKERKALAAWWWLKSCRAAANSLGVSEQTVKNLLHKARNRHNVHRTADLAYMYIRDLDPPEGVRTSHNRGERAVAA